MRNPELVGIPTIASGLVELCFFLEKEFGESKATMWELGSFAGESAAYFAHHFKTVHCVDPWDNACGAASIEEVEASFDERAKEAGNMVKHKGRSEEFAPTIPDGSLDFVYIDSGEHTFEEALRDFKLWWPKIRSGGYLGGHDWEIPELHAADVFPGVKVAVYHMLGQHPEVYGLKIFPDTSWIVRRP
jgi:cephalosporin hydroxylase